jgi:hypothetical protein
MIRGGFLSEDDRKALIALARDGSMVCRVTRRANALVLLDDGKSCQEVAEALLFDDDTIRGWHALFEQSGIEGLSVFDAGRSSGLMVGRSFAVLQAVGAFALEPIKVRTTRPPCSPMFAPPFPVINRTKPG